MTRTTKVPDPVDVYVGSRVKARRLQLGISQERLALSIGVTFQQVQKYERGVNRISASRLQQIGRRLGMEPSLFFDQAEKQQLIPASASEDPELEAVKEFVQSKEGVSLNQAFSLIKDDDLRLRIIRLVEALAADEKPFSASPATRE